LAEAGVQANYVPHMVDCQVMYPEKERQAQFKKWLGVPEDCFLVGIVAANKGERKALTECFEAVRMMMDKYDDVYLYCHTLSTPQEEGRDLHADVRAIGLVGPGREGRVRFPTPYFYGLGFGDDQMRQLYNAMDVLLATSKGEGFGIPILEAQACGTPVIVTDYSAMPELVGAGWKAKWTQQFWTYIQGQMVVPDIESIYECLEEAYRADRSRMVEPAREFALAYDREKVREEYWRPVMEHFAEEIKPPAWPELAGVK
jgi:glycosyltransferase involved in cell wall biosynthesis